MTNNCTSKHVFSFTGGAWVHPFYFGVASCLQNHVKNIEREESISFCGSSISAVVLTSMLFKLNLKEVCYEAISKRNNTYILCNMINVYNMIENVHKMIDKYIVDESIVHQLTNKLIISLTKYTSPFKFENVRFDKYTNIRELKDVIKGSCHLKMFPYYVGGIRVYDAVFSNPSNMSQDIRSRLQETDILISVTTEENNELQSNEYNINPNISLPILWRVFPPNITTLTNMYKLGYYVTYIFLSNYDGLNNCSMDLDLLEVTYEINSLKKQITNEITKLASTINCFFCFCFCIFSFDLLPPCLSI
tara:strand:- start:245 stop:1159 length:915 start_codon:yes stop_codon:yes gene_type:complete